MSSGEKTSHEKNVPKIFQVGIWSAAVISAGAFAFVVGLLAYNSIESPILAYPNTQQTTCPSGTLQYAVNNYPENVAAGEHDKYYKKMGVDPKSAWRCSLYCIPVPYPELPPIWNAENLSTARAYIKNNCDAKIATNKQDFDLLTGPEMLKAIILDSLKPKCDGPNSIDYNPKILCESGKNQPIARPTPTPTPTPTPKPKIQAPTTNSGGAAQPAEQGLNIVTSAGGKTKTSTTSKNEKVTRQQLQSQLKECKKLLDEEIYNAYDVISQQDVQEYLDIKSARPIWSNSVKKVRDRCFALLNEIRDAKDQFLKENSSQNKQDFPPQPKIENIQINGRVIYDINAFSKYSNKAVICAYLVSKKYGNGYKRFKINQPDGIFNLEINNNLNENYKELWIYIIDKGQLLSLQLARNSLLKYKLSSIVSPLNIGDIVLGEGAASGKNGVMVAPDGIKQYLEPENLKKFMQVTTKHDCLTDTQL